MPATLIVNATKRDMEEDTGGSINMYPMREHLMNEVATLTGGGKHEAERMLRDLDALDVKKDGKVDIWM